MEAILNGQILRVLLEAAGAYPWTLTYVPIGDADGDAGTPVTTRGNTNGTTPVDLITGISGSSLELKSLNLRVTAAAVVKMRLHDGSGDTDFKRFTLSTGDQLEWNALSGWKVLDVTGAQKGAGGGGSSLTVEELDGVPSVSGVTKIKVSNGTLTDDGGGVVEVTTGGGGSGSIAPAYVL